MGSPGSRILAGWQQLFSQVNLAMFDQHRALAEVSATLDAPVGLLRGVYSPVLAKSRTVIETFLIVHTLVGILARVDTLVGANCW